jgi:hypothetical protein
MSTESQAERMETAATEFQRRFHISADDEHNSSAANDRRQVIHLNELHLKLIIVIKVGVT